MEQIDRTVLFVCTGNYYRSRYAELLFNALAPSGLGWRADSRGFAPGPWNIGAIAPLVLERLAASGIAVPRVQRAPLRLARADMEAADLLIALDEAEHRPYVEGLGPPWSSRFRLWVVPDLHEWPAERALPTIDQEVRALLDELSSR
ncbi:low molecular weight phosphatase family protein [Oscillochloris sp. ZM17-4]|uniref:arsenate-mycothiol transferase ArsC n=1 Tax=Oscillochloris sp. ZM17-4 TaxID=2866714 RepID=UPI001C72A50F|nr:low molecular weight phosphatase family protein [Oscillochloris sp. ZM17-4]MBX0329606.1 low molecular weight phosphatase family protein [Oscillochloris sp. ZM17-4]